MECPCCTQPCHAALSWKVLPEASKLPHSQKEWEVGKLGSQCVGSFWGVLKSPAYMLCLRTEVQLWGTVGGSSMCGCDTGRSWKRKSMMVRKQAGRKSLRAGEHSQAAVAIWGEEWKLF